MRIPLESVLYWTSKIGIWLLLLTPLIVSSQLYFPFITGKNLFFRIVVEIVFGAWLGLLLLNKDWLPKRSILLVAFAVFVGVLSLTTLTGVDPYYSFWSNLERMEGLFTHLHLFILFLVLISLFRERRDWIVLWTISFGVSVLISIIGIFEILGVVTPPGSGAGRIVATFGNPIFLAAYLLIHLFVTALLFWWATDWWRRGIYTAVFIVHGIVLMFTGTRGALLGLVMGVAIVLAIIMIASKSRYMRMISMGLFGAGVLLVMALFMARDSSLVQSNMTLSRFADIRLTSSTAQSRFMIWGIAWDGFKERPLVGWGLGNFNVPYAIYYNPNLYGSEPWFDRVHNMHLEWLIAGGVVGLLAYIALFGSAVFLLWKLQRRSMFDIPTAALITGLFVAYLVQNTFVFDTITTYLFIILLFGFLHITSYGEEQSACQKMQKISIYSAERFAKGVIPLGAAVVVSLLFNIRFIHAAESIVSMLKQANTNRVEEVLQEYDRAVAYSMLSATEARIQLFNMSVQAEQNYAFSKTDYLMLLDKAIEESRQEISRRTSQNVRVRITLAKLLQLRFVFTGNEDDFESSWAMYRESIGIAPHFPPAYIGIAETYLAAGQTVQAADAVDYIYREITKPNALVYPVLLVSVQGSNFDRAIRVLDYQKSLGGIPRHPRKAFLDPQKMLLVIERSFTSDDYEGRKKFLEHMLQSRGDFFETKIDSAYLYISLAETEKQLGNTEQARAAIVQYQQDVPDDSIFVENYLKEL